MNQAFKVLWNRFRNSYVVASEAHASHGKSGKAAKTVLAAAVAGAIAFGGTAAAAMTALSVETTPRPSSSPGRIPRSSISRRLGVPRD